MFRSRKLIGESVKAEYNFTVFAIILNASYSLHGSPFRAEFPIDDHGVLNQCVDQETIFVVEPSGAADHIYIALVASKDL